MWACAACTLLNAHNESVCGACGGIRWVLPHDSKRVGPRRAVAAEALRAARRQDRSCTDDDQNVCVPDGGLWDGGLGPDREWMALPPPPSGQGQHRAEDGDFDIFGGGQDAEEASSTLESSSLASVPVPSDGKSVTKDTEGGGRPVWRQPGDPLFAGRREVAALEPAGVADEDFPFDAAVARLARLGFDPTKCHFALQASGGDEQMAREFLASQT
eukprot:gnl/TRDRNA2_/TRDRNA2_137064_c0_seq2.p1 gnl/TRDRNA2_/TRDRNA2_137064_c0~~gnl/TRDRNA2_/TRDRNA2_137064_c0_seq2.p1  ORF type:complete len:215 (+),score=34.63 gnl/TRDRNA2_/TRDRNA2_137064_c0_seq2:61-705(+)